MKSVSNYYERQKTVSTEAKLREKRDNKPMKAINTPIHAYIHTY